jgi:hypothetical protein
VKRFIRASFIWVAILAVASCSSPEIKPRAPIQILTALPLFWGEGEFGAVLQGGAGQSPLITALQKDGPVRAIDHVDASGLDQQSILFMIQPPALSPQELVAIDAFVRGGGRVVALADPELSWEQSAPTGSALRAPPQSLLTPLYEHWGLRLEGDKMGDAIVDTVIFGQGAGLLTPGRWTVNTPGQGGKCALSDDKRMADCAIGKGRAVLIADADFANPEFWPDSDDDNLSAIRVLLGEVSTKQNN